MAASRGCYWGRCGFCPEAVAPTHSYRCHDPATFPAMLRELSLRYGAARFHLTDNALPPATLRALAARPDALRGLSWHGFARFERDLLAPGFASGLAATDTVLRLLNSGDHVLAGNDVYGGTYRVFEKVFRPWGLDFTFVDTTDVAQIEAVFSSVM